MEDLFKKRQIQISEFNDSLRNMRLRGLPYEAKPREIPDDLLIQCPKCKKTFIRIQFEENLSVCPECNYHKRLSYDERLRQVFDDEWNLLYSDLKTKNNGFPGYEEKLNKAQKMSKSDESVVCAKGKIGGIEAYVAVMDSNFMMGSMGVVCGERITRLAEDAKASKRPLIIFCTSGGARMQEGVNALFQMAKTSAAIKAFRETGLYISILTDPTTGGVSASFASLADITLAEPKALIGFAGKRVIEQTIKETLPDSFQTAEFLQEKGFIDKIVTRKDLKKTLVLLLRLHNYN